MKMKHRIVKADQLRETKTIERCFVAENWSSNKISIARARVRPGTTTRVHHLKGVDEIYLITKGHGVVEIGESDPAEVETGDTIYIPSGTSQRITNAGRMDLVFYCICNPRFTQDCYCDDEK
jgi:mannose-6-phosphate isomerase-like protein (cupin superfamily)